MMDTYAPGARLRMTKTRSRYGDGSTPGDPVLVVPGDTVVVLEVSKKRPMMVRTRADKEAAENAPVRYLVRQPDTTEPLWVDPDEVEPVSTRGEDFADRLHDELECGLPPGVVGLTENEAGLIKGLIRENLRKLDRNRRSSVARFGAAYDSTQHDERESLLESAYRKLGGDPKRIQNRQGWR